jgi:hypothetical protein
MATFSEFPSQPTCKEVGLAATVPPNDYIVSRSAVSLPVLHSRERVGCYLISVALET